MLAGAVSLACVTIIGDYLRSSADRNSGKDAASFGLLRGVHLYYIDPMSYCENRNRIPWMRLVLGFALSVAFLQPSLPAQAILAAAADALTVAENNRTARAGDLVFLVSTGTTGSNGTVVIDYGLPIEEEGRVSGLAGATIEEVDSDSGAVSLGIPAGMTGADRVTVEGFRLDMAAAETTSVVANLSVLGGAAFFILPENASVVVISQVLPGLKVDPESDVVFSIPKNSVTSQPEKLTLTIKENFPTAFSGHAEYFNQNVATRLQIRIGNLPPGASVTFPESTTSPASDAIFTVLSGSETTLPTEDGERSITYEFSPSVSSDRRAETFRFDYTLEVEERLAETTLVFLQATLAPGEEEECNGDPCVPRYRAQFIPSHEALPFPEFESYFPGSSSLGRLTRLKFTNPRDFELGVHLEALSPAGEPVSGPEIVNPASLTIAVGGQVSGLVQDIFGPGILEVETGTIVARSRRAQSGNFFFFGDDATVALDSGRAVQDLRKQFLLPHLFREGQQPFTRLHFFNPSPEIATELALALHDGAGETVSSIQRSLGPRETISESAASLFDVDPKDFQYGYIRGEATEGVVASQTFGNEMTVNHLAAQAASLQGQFYGVAHIGVGAGLETELNLINSHDLRQARFRISIVDDLGQAVTAPAELVLQPHQQRVVGLSALFEMPATGVLTGSLEIELLDVFLGPYLRAPSINGSVRFKRLDGRSSTTLPLFRAPVREALYAHVAQDQGFFTGVAIKNRADVPLGVTVEAYDDPGNLVGEADFELGPGVRTAKLLSELIPATAGQSGGTFRVRSPDGAVESFALFGAGSGDVLSTVPRD